MRLTPQRCQFALQPIQRGAGQADHLLTLIDQLHAIESARADQHDIAVVVVAIRGGATGQAGVGCLHNDDAVGRNRGPQDLPLLQQGAGLDHRQHLPLAGTVALAKAPRLLLAGQHITAANQTA